MQATLISMARRSRLARFALRLTEGRHGTAAVEFAMIALPFMALLMGIFEVGMIYLVSTSLENATTDVARQIRTGQLQTAGGATSTTFANSICSELSWLGSSCSSNLFVDVRTFASFSTITQTSPIQNGKVNTANLQFQIGTAGQVVLVRAYYQWTLIAPLLDGFSAQLSNGSTLLTATAAFQNEPYSSNGT
jgi:Flp pilus assembly protein TadG